jgi:hypothetical protein
VLEVGAPPSIEGTPAGGAAFVAGFFFATGRLVAALPVAFLAGFFAAFFFADRLAFFFAVFGADFFAVFVFFAAFFLAAIPDPPVKVIYVTYMVTYVSCQTKNLTTILISQNRIFV